MSRLEHGVGSFMGCVWVKKVGSEIGIVRVGWFFHVVDLLTFGFVGNDVFRNV